MSSQINSAKNKHDCFQFKTFFLTVKCKRTVRPDYVPSSSSFFVHITFMTFIFPTPSFFPSLAQQSKLSLTQQSKLGIWTKEECEEVFYWD